MYLEFGMAQKYVDDLSANVKRGLHAKAQMGWLPGPTPLGCGQLLNYFHASLKLDHKERKGGKVQRIYGAAQTPLARVLASAEVSAATKERLLQDKARLNLCKSDPRHRSVFPL